MTWLDQAACRGCDPDLWHPWGTDYKSDTAPAVDVCRQCPVRLSCLDHAVRTREPDGIWGGLDPDQRRSYARRQQRTAHRLRDILSTLDSEVAP